MIKIDQNNEHVENVPIHIHFNSFGMVMKTLYQLQPGFEWENRSTEVVKRVVLSKAHDENSRSTTIQSNFNKSSNFVFGVVGVVDRLEWYLNIRVQYFTGAHTKF